ncbi:ABC transporter family protein [Paraburkholderia sp. BL23I1N1]|nr:ABC transporter family protein [Paraburkholderia sp. BL23I1N1]
MEPIQKQPFQGLNFEQSIPIPDRVVAIVGRNGAGKSRLLRAIKQKHILVMQDGSDVPQNRILDLSNIAPGLSILGEDGFSTHAYAALEFYKANKDKFLADDLARNRVRTQHTPEEAFGNGSVALLLQQDVEFGAMLVDRTPQQVRFATPRSKSSSSMSRRLNWTRKCHRTAQPMTLAGKR